MDLPTELRCQIYEFCLTAQGPYHETISLDELRFRAFLRKSRHELEPLTNDGMRRLAMDYDLVDDSRGYVKDMLDHDGTIKPLLHVSILRVSHQVHEEASDILYGRNSLSIKPNFHRQNERLHYQFVNGLLPSPVRYLHLDLVDNGRCGCESRAMHAWEE